MRPGVAYAFDEGDDGDGVPVGLLQAHTALVFNTSNTPQEREQRVFGDPLQALWQHCIFGLCGVPRFYRAMYGVIGANGSGKSTLLRLMAGIHRPTSGEVHTRGRISALLELGTGFHPELSGRENVYLNASILGIDRSAIDDILEEIVAFADIGEFIDSPVKIYSSGMKVRLGFSVAVHVDPEILLLDEVIAVGDERFKRKCFEHVYELRRQGVTIVLVTHSMGHIQNMCDRAVWLDQGRVVEQGDAVQVAHNYLQQVNVDEDAGGAESQTPTSRARRRGTHEITIEGLRFINGRAQVTPSGASGRPLMIKIFYKAREPILDPVFAITVHTDSGTVVSGPNSRRAQFSPGSLSGEGAVMYQIPRLALTPGTYHLSLAIHDTNNLHVYDARDREFELRVQPGSANDTDGLVDLGGKWVVCGRRL